MPFLQDAQWTPLGLISPLGNRATRTIRDVVGITTFAFLLASRVIHILQLSI